MLVKQRRTVISILKSFSAKIENENTGIIVLVFLKTSC